MGGSCDQTLSDDPGSSVVHVAVGDDLYLVLAIRCDFGDHCSDDMSRTLQTGRVDTKAWTVLSAYNRPSRESQHPNAGAGDLNLRCRSYKRL